MGLRVGFLMGAPRTLVVVGITEAEVASLRHGVVYSVRGETIGLPAGHDLTLLLAKTASELEKLYDDAGIVGAHGSDQAFLTDELRRKGQTGDDSDGP